LKGDLDGERLLVTGDHRSSHRAVVDLVVGHLLAALLLLVVILRRVAVLDLAPDLLPLHHPDQDLQMEVHQLVHWLHCHLDHAPPPETSQTL
jgi:hypothetical protein